LIGDLLDLSKIEADRFELDSEPTEIALVVEEARAVMPLAAQQKELSLRTFVAADVPRFAATDPGRLRQVLLNLLSNAIKFTGQGGVELSVRCESRKNGVTMTCFEVRDTGIGFEPSKAAAIFEPFIQADNSMSRRYGGTGLGLSICRRIVELLGGTIGCTSTPGEGSTFWFVIPLLRVNDPAAD
jgi:signal transduction histidine kinase